MLVMNSIINNRQVRLNLRSGEIFMQFRNTEKWKVKPPYRSGQYLQMRIGNKMYQQHRVIYKIWNPDWDIDDGSIKNNSIDHKNGNTTDNRIANLRNVTHQQNHCNRTRAKGYSWNKQAKKWHAEIKLNHKKIYLGCYDLEEDARNAYLEAKKIYHIITE
jgi:hypothetical protein